MAQQLLSPAKAIRTVRKTNAILAEVLRGVTQEQSNTLRDGDDGWSILYIVCHLRDYERLYRERVERMLTEEHPTFLVRTNEEWIAEGNYAAQDVRAVLDDIAQQRVGLIARLEGLSEGEWSRTGFHPQQGHATILDVAINVGLHDIDHTEQLVRCLGR
jgi:hypothetical protein